MRTVKSVFGVIGALLPVVYCGGLLFYFFDLTGSVEEAKDIGLGPTMLGLGVVGLIFCIPLLLKIVRMVAGLRPPGSGGEPSAPAFDADAAIARYKAAQSHDVPRSGPAAPRVSGAATKQFGRRSR